MWLRAGGLGPWRPVAVLLVVGPGRRHDQPPPALRGSPGSEGTGTEQRRLQLNRNSGVRAVIASPPAIAYCSERLGGWAAVAASTNVPMRWVSPALSRDRKEIDVSDRRIDEAYRDDAEYTSPEMQAGRGEDLHPPANEGGAVAGVMGLSIGAAGGALAGEVLGQEIDAEQADLQPAKSLEGDDLA